MQVTASRRTLVISAVNLIEGGTFTVLREAVRAAADHFPDWRIIVAVHRVGIVGDPRVEEIGFPEAKRSWGRRLWLEWIGFARLSRQWQADVWLSLHDITPRVHAGRQYVYCHNPAPFCTQPVPLERLDLTFRLFRRFYGMLYRCFIRRNTAVVVQQAWLRDEFKRRYPVRQVIVAHPDVHLMAPEPRTRKGRPSVFLFPSFPRVFKNFEAIGAALETLEADPRWSGEVVVTIDGTENPYAREIRRRYGGLRTLRFAGLQPPDRMRGLYAEADAVLFPSLLETWGLPLTEAKACNMPILAIDLPYARETIGSYGAAAFFEPGDPAALAAAILALHTGARAFGPVETQRPAEPFAGGWHELLTMLLQPEPGTQPPPPTSGA